MKRCAIIPFVLIFILCLSGCAVPSYNNAEEKPSMPVIETVNTKPSAPPETLQPASTTSITPEITSVVTNQCRDVMVQNGKIYFINGWDKGNLYCMNIDGSEKRKLNDDWTETFYVSGDQIFYMNGSDHSKLYSIKTDGSGRRKLSDDQLTFDWNVVDDQIYYSNWDDNSALYKIKTDGSDREKISDEDTLYMNVLGDRIYYSAKGICSIKTDGSGKIKLSDDRPYLMLAAGDWIYYTNDSDDNKLYTIKTDGSNRHKLSDDYALNINVVDDRIYYSGGGKIYSMKTDGSDKKLLSNDPVEWMVVQNGRIYYTMTGSKIYSMSTSGGDKLFLADLSSNAYKDVTYEISARLHKDMPEYRFVATGITPVADDWAAGYVMGLNVFDESGQPILTSDFSFTYYDEVTGNPVYTVMMDTMGLHVVDVNFDGYKDVIVLSCFAGAHSNTWYYCWLWDPETSSFVESESFSAICNPALDPKEKCIYSAGGESAAFWGGSIYKYINGEFVMTNDLNADENGLTETKLKNGKMTVAREVNYNTDDTTEEAEIEYYKDSKLWQLDNPRWYMVGGHHADQWLGN